MYYKSPAPYRSVKEIQSFLLDNPFSSESQIQERVFGYFRNSSYESNKKYADMLRRGLDKGLYKRAEYRKKSGYDRSRFWYYIPDQVKNNL